MNGGVCPARDWSDLPCWRRHRWRFFLMAMCVFGNCRASFDAQNVPCSHVRVFSVGKNTYMTPGHCGGKICAWQDRRRGETSRRAAPYYREIRQGPGPSPPYEIPASGDIACWCHRVGKGSRLTRVAGGVGRCACRLASSLVHELPVPGRPGEFKRRARRVLWEHLSALYPPV